MPSVVSTHDATNSNKLWIQELLDSNQEIKLEYTLNNSDVTTAVVANKDNVSLSNADVRSKLEQIMIDPDAQPLDDIMVVQSGRSEYEIINVNNVHRIIPTVSMTSEIQNLYFQGT